MKNIQSHAIGTAWRDPYRNPQVTSLKAFLDSVLFLDSTALEARNPLYL